jgi:hypothetical protein
MSASPHIARDLVGIHKFSDAQLFREHRRGGCRLASSIRAAIMMTSL